MAIIRQDDVTPAKRHRQQCHPTAHHLYEHQAARSSLPGLLIPVKLLGPRSRLTRLFHEQKNLEQRKVPHRSTDTICSQSARKECQHLQGAFSGAPSVAWLAPVGTCRCGEARPSSWHDKFDFKRFAMLLNIGSRNRCKAKWHCPTCQCGRTESNPPSAHCAAHAKCMTRHS